jgi:hypothetical protein
MRLDTITEIPGTPNYKLILVIQNNGCSHRPGRAIAAKSGGRFLIQVERPHLIVFNNSLSPGDSTKGQLISQWGDHCSIRHNPGYNPHGYSSGGIAVGIRLPPLHDLGLALRPRVRLSTARDHGAAHRPGSSGATRPGHKHILHRIRCGHLYRRLCAGNSEPELGLRRDVADFGGLHPARPSRSLDRPPSRNLHCAVADQCTSGRNP